MWVCHFCGHEYRDRFNPLFSDTNGLCDFCHLKINQEIMELNFYHETYKTSDEAYTKELTQISQKYGVPQRTFIRRARARAESDAKIILEMREMVEKAVRKIHNERGDEGWF